jgi:hypothetical protein
MSSEVSIAKQLSGTECLDACLFELRKILIKDGRFQSHMAYQGFRAEISFKFYPAIGFVPPTEREIEVTGGDTAEVETVPTVDETLTLKERPPNQVREEADMHTPVLVTENDGKTHEKWVKRGKAPKNTVKGGGQ